MSAEGQGQMKENFTSQTHDQSMLAEGQGQMKGKFYILSTHCTAMQKGQA
jgi:hypothetical protein